MQQKPIISFRRRPRLNFFYNSVILTFVCGQCRSNGHTWFIAKRQERDSKREREKEKTKRDEKKDIFLCACMLYIKWYDVILIHLPSLEGITRLLYLKNTRRLFGESTNGMLQTRLIIKAGSLHQNVSFDIIIFSMRSTGFISKKPKIKYQNFLVNNTLVLYTIRCLNWRVIIR